ncbi:MAG: pyrimidine/purine nucleoside phosphorylase [Campylobacterales bacterium]|nr:pyrimidine/purine nucleoside phosphorylase [Campylobacterales bacterium]MBE0499694.1 pyrimidine/purine nucleoside phosphorylase [Campylobacterales bacterium]
MTEFKNVTVAKAANFYFDGKVTSRTLTFADGSTKTLGVMMPGEYEFGTGERELMEITAGEMDVKLPGAEEFVTIKGGEEFAVPANTKFQVKVKTVSDYCCSYFKD